jgi:hypothetical protein
MTTTTKNATTTKTTTANVTPIKSNGATKPTVPAVAPVVPAAVAPVAPIAAPASVKDEPKKEDAPKQYLNPKVVELLTEGKPNVRLDKPAPSPVVAAKPTAPVKAKELGKAEKLSVSSRLLKAALLCVSDDEQARAAFCGVHFTLRGGRVEMVATNGTVMLVQSITQMAGVATAKWLEQGVTFDAARLASAVKMAPKDAFLDISFGENHPNAVIEPTDWCSIKVRPIEMPFAKYDSVIAASASSFIGGEAAPMSTDGALSSADAKLLGQVTLALEAKGAIPHISRENGPTVFTFGAAADAVLYVMPIRMDVAVSTVAAHMLAKPLAMSIAALKGHISLYQKKLPSAKGAEKDRIETKISDLQARLANINVKPLLGKTTKGGDVKEVAPKVVRQAAKSAK